MMHISSTADPAGAWVSHVQPKRQALPGMGSLAQQPAFRPVFRREIMTAINICRRELGLRHGSLAVLDALLSFLPCRAADGSDAPVTPLVLLTVFASNESVCFRAKGLTDRQLRRNIEVLEAAGLVIRRDSSNGKRFPILQNGKAIGAFGLDLTPVFARSAEILALAARRQRDTEELRGLRAQILQLRSACNDLMLQPAAVEFVDGLRNVLRRAALTVVEARALLRRLMSIVSDSAGQSIATEQVEIKPASERKSESLEIAFDVSSESTLTRQTPATDGQNVRHKETESDSKKLNPGQSTEIGWSGLDEISAFYPEPEDFRETSQIAFDFGRMLRLSQDAIATAISKIGVWQLLKLQNHIARESQSIQNPEAYLRTALRQAHLS